MFLSIRSGTEAAPRPLAGPGVVGLAVRSPGHPVDDDHVAGALEPGRAAALDGVGDVVRVGGPARRRRHHGGDGLAEAVVGHADDDDVSHRPALLDRLLDLLGEDLLAARVDRHRPAAEERDRAVLLDGRVVARDRVPTPVDLAEGLGRLVCVLEVPERDVTADGEMPLLPPPGLHPPTPAVDLLRLSPVGALAGPPLGRARWVLVPEATPV